MMNENIGAGPGFLGRSNRMIDFAPDAGGGGAPEPDLVAEAIARQASYGMRERRAERFLRWPQSPDRVIVGTRFFLKKTENPVIASEGENRWDPSAVVDILFERQEDLSVSVDELEEKGLITNYDPRTGFADLLDKDAASYAIWIEESYEFRPAERIKSPDGNYQVREVLTPVYKYYFGRYARKKDSPLIGETNEKGNLNLNERELLARVYERMLAEFNARLVLNTHVSIRMSALRDNLEGLVTTLYERASKLKIPHLKEIFNLASPDGINKDKEDHKYGLQLEKSIWWLMAMLNSETPEKLEEFLSRPATKELIGKGMADEDLQRFLKQHLGDWEKWKRGKNRNLKTLAEERKAKLRGPVTMWGNIPGRGERLSYNEETDFIQKIGELAGAEDSSIPWLAATILRAFGVFSSEGYVALPNGETNLALGTGTFLSSDDLGKCLMYLNALKEGYKGRPTGPKYTIGRMPDIAISFFDVQIKVDEDENGEPIKKKIKDAWLGEPGTDSENYHRLGELDFGSLVTDIQGEFFQMQWLIGREGWGVISQILKTEFTPDDFGLDPLKKLWKYFGIVYNPAVLGLSGKEAKAEAEKIAEHAFINLMAARILSESFKLKVANQTMEITTTEGPLQVSWAILADLHIQAVLDGNPATEEEIIKNYLDRHDQIKEAAFDRGKIQAVYEKYLNWLERNKVPAAATIRGKNSF